MKKKKSIPSSEGTDQTGLPQRNADLTAKSFRDLAALERWLLRQRPDAQGIWLKLRKKMPGQQFLTRQEAIDAALCHGWIDGQAKTHDESSYLIRFTPRRPRSLWSRVNRERAMLLLSEGRVQPGGMAQMEAAKVDGRWASAYAPASSVKIPEDLQAAFDLHPEAASHFRSLKSTARYQLLHSLETVKRNETRVRKINAFIEHALTQIS